MPTFIGFNTINQYKKFVLTDFELIKRDLLNYLNIRQGECVGNPSLGTTVWSLVFEPQGDQTNTAIYNEINRVLANDPRIRVSDVQLSSVDNGVLLEMIIQTVATTDAERLRIFFNQSTSRAYAV
jgi:phage baseplate assembly protein W